MCILYSHLGNVVTKECRATLQWHKELSLTGGFHSAVLWRNSLLVEGAAPQVEEVELGCVKMRARPIKRERLELPGPGWPRLGGDSGGGGGGRPGRVRDGDRMGCVRVCVCMQGTGWDVMCTCMGAGYGMGCVKGMCTWMCMCVGHGMGRV